MTNEIFSSEGPIFTPLGSHTFIARKEVTDFSYCTVAMSMLCLKVWRRTTRCAQSRFPSWLLFKPAQWSCVSCHLHMRKQPFFYILNSSYIAIVISLQFLHIRTYRYNHIYYLFRRILYEKSRIINCQINDKNNVRALALIARTQTHQYV